MGNESHKNPQDWNLFTRSEEGGENVAILKGGSIGIAKNYKGGGKQHWNTLDMVSKKAINE